MHFDVLCGRSFLRGYTYLLATNTYENFVHFPGPFALNRFDIWNHDAMDPPRPYLTSASVNENIKISMFQGNPIFFGTAKPFANDQQNRKTARAENVHPFRGRNGASRALI